MRGNCSINFWQLLNYLSECDANGKVCSTTMLEERVYVACFPVGGSMRGAHSDYRRSSSRYHRGGKKHRHGQCQQKKADKVVNV